MYAMNKSSPTKHGESEKSLCQTCEHQSSCRLNNRKEGAIFHCEEFSTEPSPRGDLPASKEIRRTGPDHPEMKGLCQNCENAAECRLPKAPGGVWHCEEYL